MFGTGGSGGFNVAIGVSFQLGVMGKGPEYLSAIPIYADGQLNILFNDNKKNKGITDMDEIKSLGNYNNAVPTLFQFDNQGNITRKDPEEVIKNELVIRPGVYYRKNNKEFIIYSTLSTLVKEQKIASKVATDAMKKYNIDPKKPIPTKL